METIQNKKVAVVTGATQGLGEFAVIRLAKDGYNVAINCRSQARVEEVGNTIKAKCEEYGVEAECFVADVSRFDECEKMVKAIKERFGRIDVLVNNAGMTKDGLIARMTEEQFDIITNVNYKSVFNMTRHITPIMMKQRYGRIINITSVAGVYGNAGQFNYAASKAGIVGMTLSASKELGSRNITVNAIAPGFIDTAMTEVLDATLKENILSQVSMKRLGKPEEIAGTISFLASEDANYITGQVIVVDGGLAM